MSSITTNYNTSVQTDYKVQNSTPLTDAEIKAKVIEVQNENLQAIQKGLDQNESVWSGKVKIKVPADANGNPISKPTAQDWENAAKSGKFAEVEGSPGSLAYQIFGLELVNFGDASSKNLANKALLEELRDALGKGISFPTTETLPRSDVGDVARALQARQRALADLERGMGNPNAGTMDPPRERVDIKVPAGPDGKPIKNPSTKDWIDAEKNNRWVSVSGKPADLASDYFGVKIDMANWRDSYKANKAAFFEASEYGIQKFGSFMRVANGEFDPGAIIDIPNAGKIIAEVLAVLGPAYNTELSKANELREQMDSLKKKNEAIKKFENSLEKNSAGNDQISVEVPTSRYVYDKDGNKVKNEDGSFKTEPVGKPPSNEDWARAATFKEVNGKADSLAQEYFNINYQKKDGNNKDDHYANLTANTGKWNNERTSVSSEMSKLSGQFDLRMGNAQTNLQNANKLISNINDMMMGIARGI